MSRPGAAAWLAIPLLAASLACGTTAAPPSVIAPLPAFTMPPEWTPTPEFLPASIPGWETFAGRGLELMLPPSYEGGDPLALAEELAALLAEVPQYAEIAQAIRDDPGGYRLLTLDRETGSILAVTAHDVPEAVSMGEYVDTFSAAVIEQAPGSALIQKGVIPFRNGEAGWMLFEFTLEDAVSWQLTYALRRGGQVWNLNYGAIREDYPLLQPIFDQSLQSVQFTP
jgi:serine/threonine-protein kinase